MSRSWDESGRELINDLKETLRQHFKSIGCSTVDTHLETPGITYHLAFEPEAFGGILLEPDYEPNEIPLEFNIPTRALETQLSCQSNGSTTLLPKGKSHAIPLYWHRKRRSFSTPLIPAQAKSFSVDKAEITLPQKLASYQTFSPIPKLKGAEKIPIEKFRMPSCSQPAQLTTKTNRFSLHQKILPIHRSPIPPHRFSSKLRQHFRELLADRAGCTVVDIQLIGVYDRIYLSMYQSISQAEDGTLLCYPKPQTTIPKDSEVSALYLIIGKSVKIPNKVFQVICPMEDIAL